MRMNVGTKIGAGYAVALLIFIIVGIVTYSNTNNIIQTAHEVEAGHHVDEIVEDILENMSYAIMGQQSYVITGRESELELFKTGVEGTHKAIAETSILVEDVPYLKERFDKMVPIIEQELGHLQKTVDYRRERGLEAAIQLNLSELDDTDEEQIRAIKEEMEHYQHEVVEEGVINMEIAAKNSQLVTVIALVGSVVVMLILGWLITQNLSVPLQELSKLADDISVGRLTSYEYDENRQDEVGSLSRAFSRMTAFLLEVSKVAESISERDLTATIKPQSEDDMLGNALANMIANLREQIGSIGEMAEVLSKSSAEMATASAQLAATSQETSTSVNETITTVEEVKQTAELANEKSSEVSENSDQVEKISQTGEQSVAKTFDVMHRIREQSSTISESIITLSEQSQLIGEIISSVNDIAEQSNLLAVNASIEAAKAGEQGRGFGVVAQEIKSLADQSKQATGQVRDLLTDIQKAVGSAVMATDQGSKEVDAGVQQSTEAAEAIKALAQNVREGAVIAKQIAASSSQQLVGMDQITTAMYSIGQANQQNLDAAKNFEKATQDLNAAGIQLKQTVEQYKL